MLDLSRIIFIPGERAKIEASQRGAIKKLVDKLFTREDKKRILSNKGITGKKLDEGLDKFIPEQILPPDEIELVSKEGNSFVIESQSIALSYTSGKGPEDPHWHPDEVETYLTSDPINVAIRSIDGPVKHKILNFPPGRLILPPRVCHFTDLRSHTEVMSFRQHPIMQRVNCSNCHLYESDDCSALIKSDDGFQGEDTLVSLAKERLDWLERNR